MERILLSLEKYSNVITAIATCLMTIATCLIWNVSRKQTEYMYLIGKASEQPIIMINRELDNLGNYPLRDDLGPTVEKGKEMYCHRFFRPLSKPRL